MAKEETAAPAWSRGTRKLFLDANGRMVIPADWRKKLELEPGMGLLAYLDDDHRIVLSDGTEIVEHFRRKVGVGRKRGKKSKR